MTTYNKKIKLLILTQYFPPETGAAASRMSDYALLLKDIGYDITVVCESPTYFMSAGQENKEMSDWKGIHVIHSWVSKNSRKTTLQRFIFYLSYMFSSFLKTLFVGEFDIIWVTSPPLTTAFIGMLISKIRRKPYILDIRDLWPESVIELGALKNPALIWILKKIEKNVYKNAVSLSLAVPGFKDRINSTIYPKQDFIELPNGVSDLFLMNKKAESPLNKITKGKFVVLFSGNIGIAQGLDNVLLVAEALKNEKDIIFLFVGDGVEKDRLMEITEEKHLKNIYFAGTYPKENMPAIISSADICLVHLKKLELFNSALPSKMFEYLAMSKPVVINIPGEAKALIEKHTCGVFCEPENTESFVKTIIDLKNNPNKSMRLGNNGYDYVSKQFTRKSFIPNLENKIQSVLNN